MSSLMDKDWRPIGYDFNEKELPSIDTVSKKSLGNYIPSMGVMQRRIGVHGGPFQQDRMIRDKRRSFDRAIKYSYQAARIRRPGSKHRPAPALINPNKLKQDYDDKILSVGFEFGYQPGDVFEWLGTKTYWLIYLQDLTELAYFRGDIRKCSYELFWEDEDGQHSTYAAVRGPVETKINYIQKHQISADIPNLSLNLLLPKTEAIINYFKRYSRFYLTDYINNPESKICWRVEAYDSISTPGILEVTAVEFYANITTDNIEEGVVDQFINKEEPPIDDEDVIMGESFIKPRGKYEYVAPIVEGAAWEIDKRYPVKYSISQIDDELTKIEIQWDNSYSGQFELKYGDSVKTIVVESLF